MLEQLFFPPCDMVLLEKLTPEERSTALNNRAAIRRQLRDLAGKNVRFTIELL